jgi:hypothetical protein
VDIQINCAKSKRSGLGQNLLRNRFGFIDNLTTRKDTNAFKTHVANPGQLDGFADLNTRRGNLQISHANAFHAIARLAGAF